MTEKRTLPLGLAAFLLPLLSSLFLVYSALSSHVQSSIRLLGILSQADGETAQRVLGLWLSSSSHSDLEAGRAVLMNCGYGITGTQFLKTSYLADLMPAIVISVLTLLLLAGILWGRSRTVQGLRESLQVQKHRIHDLEHQLGQEQLRLSQMDDYEGNLYHQLKTPITAISLCLEQMTASLPQLTSQQGWQSAKREAEKLNRLCTLLLRDKQVSSNKLKYHYEVFPLESLVSDCIESVSVLAQERNITLNWTEPEEVLISCDALWLTEAISTLLENGISHAQQGRAVSVSLESKGYACSLSIHTAGSQLKDEELHTIFQRFYSTRTGHFGIGLSMARTITQAHHGTLTAQNHEHGVCFTMTLPRLNSSEIYNSRSVTKM